MRRCEAMRYDQFCNMKVPLVLLLSAALCPAQVVITSETDKVHVLIDGKPFTDFVLSGGDAMKPYLHPLRSASGKVVTRYFPMETVADEPTDHPHQRGLWFAHEKVNGFDFWNNEANYKTTIRGRIVVDKILSTKGGKNAGSITAQMSWNDPSGIKLVDEQRVMTFSKTKTLRMIDLDITLTATADKVTFADTKDGVLGIRMARVLQEGKNSGKGITDDQPHTGMIRNAEGQEKEPAVWGKASDWVDYTGTVDGEKLGIAILDHPQNSRRARWHVRAYGLFAANPFGRNTFAKEKGEDGSVVLDKGAKLHFRYRIVIHPGDAKDAGIASIWTAYSKK